MRRSARSLSQVKSGEYFAPIGQIGVHVSLRQHSARPPYGREFFATGWLHIVIPALPAHSLSSARLYVSGIGGIGNGAPRGSIAVGPCWPATPISSSAS